MPVSCAIIIAVNNTKKKGSIEIKYLNGFGVASVSMLPDFCVFVVTRGVGHFLQLQVDLLHPSPESEKRKHKLKRLVQSPNSYFMDVKCPGTLTLLFRHFYFIPYALHDQVVIKLLQYLATRKRWSCV